MKPLLISSGEPAGIGPDICLALAGYAIPLVVLGNQLLLEQRAQKLGLDISFDSYMPGQVVEAKAKHLTVWSIACPGFVVPGEASIQQVGYVLEMLALGVDACLANQFSALVTAPVSKEIINQAGIPFTGHTEFLAQRCLAKTVVMLMVSPAMRVALVTTHLPLKNVAGSITTERLENVLEILHRALQSDFGLNQPKIKVAGLNPHAGEGGYLGTEEQEIISPAIQSMQQRGMLINGPFPADTLFVPSTDICDAFVTMYHDQGLPVIKHNDFERTVNVTLGLPIIRTSVDHGTALPLAGSGLAKHDSLFAAVELAWQMAKHRETHE